MTIGDLYVNEKGKVRRYTPEVKRREKARELEAKRRAKEAAKAEKATRR